ncbi:hypothetical protein Bpfe_002503 [Biomphalaria pfeifferi]|uniref:Uncharacterized protein n=1 Tax=Biomphalaria pfeifferi TaxID=112525 RepID=A0AAD8FLQ1_BIOPF|nr:hypothetical protein Bpfe_002503 [Biomphalaria pfeifferi]
MDHGIRPLWTMKSVHYGPWNLSTKWTMKYAYYGPWNPSTMDHGIRPLWTMKCAYYGPWNLSTIEHAICLLCIMTPVYFTP